MCSRAALVICAALVTLPIIAAHAQDAAETGACLECHAVEGARPEGESPDGVSVYLPGSDAAVLRFR